jgi:hypothetical protein
MTREIRSRRAGIPRDQAKQRPLYARVLGLQYLTPSGFLCFVFLEGTVALGVLLALAELVSWWGVLVLPVTVALMVKLNDVIAGTVIHPAGPIPAGAAPGRSVAAGPSAARRSPVRQRTGGSPDAVVRPAAMEVAPAPVEPPSLDLREIGALNTPPFTRPWASRVEELDSTQQRARQTATRRYE